MAKIIQFGSHKENSILKSSVRSAELGIASFENIEHALLDLPQTPTITDWDNQELADLYRVKQLLEQAGVHIDADRGVSDEGDPWFVFCQSNGNVFVHICRIEGIYLLDSPNMEKPLRGYNFRELINGFIQRAADQQTTANIVSIHSKNNVLLHPAVMLTALIWFLYLASEELVGIAHAEETGQNTFDLNDFLGPQIASLEDVNQAASLFQKDAGNHNNQTAEHLEDVNQKNLGDTLIRSTGSPAQNTTAAQTIALGLTAIAISYGIMKNSSLAILNNDDEQAKEIQAALRLDDKQPLVPDSIVQLDENNSTESINLEEAQTGTSNDANKIFSENLPALTIAKINIQLDDKEQGMSPSVSDDNSTQTALLQTPAAEIKTTPPDQSSITTNIGSTPLNVEFDSLQIFNTFDQDFSINSIYTKQLSSYTVNNENIYSTIELDKLTDIFVSLNAVDIIGNSSVDNISLTGTPDAGEELKFSVYGDQTKDFVNYLLSKGSIVEMVVTANEIVFLDMSAFDDADDVVYTRSWSFEDGGVISTIGHLQEFVDFGLA